MGALPSCGHGLPLAFSQSPAGISRPPCNRRDPSQYLTTLRAGYRATCGGASSCRRSSDDRRDRTGTAACSRSRRRSRCRRCLRPHSRSCRKRRSRNRPWVYASTVDRTSRISCFAIIQRGAGRSGTAGPAQRAPSATMRLPWRTRTSPPSRVSTSHAQSCEDRAERRVLETDQWPSASFVSMMKRPTA
jgi:hypothetical protein